MMELLILAVMALTIGLSEAGGYPNYQGPSVSIIKEKFGLSLLELKAKCEAKDKALWDGVLDALRLNVYLGEDLVTDIAMRAARRINPTAEEYDDLIRHRCETNTVLVNVKHFTTSQIVRCLNKNELPDESRSPEMLIKSISKTCTEVKLLAMERNAKACH